MLTKYLVLPTNLHKQVTIDILLEEVHAYFYLQFTLFPINSDNGEGKILVMHSNPSGALEVSILLFLEEDESVFQVKLFGRCLW